MSTLVVKNRITALIWTDNQLDEGIYLWSQKKKTAGVCLNFPQNFGVSDPLRVLIEFPTIFGKSRNSRENPAED